jgi:hypothetical protein
MLSALVFLVLPAAQAAELGIRAVVVKSARVSVQGPQRIVLKTDSPQAVQVTMLPAGDGAVRVVFTP